MSHTKRFSKGSLLSLFLAGLSSAGIAAEDIPLRDWFVPGYRSSAASRDGLAKQADITRGIAFVGVDPCRIADTRGVPGGPTPPYAGPALAPGVVRDFDIDSAPTCLGIPLGVEAYSLNLTVTQTQGPGDLRTWPAGSPAPLVSTLNYLANETIANAAIVPAGTGGAISVLPAVSGTHLIIDINGYFTDEYNANVGFEAIGSSATQLGLFVNNNSVLNGNNTSGFGVIGRTASAAPLAAGVKGVNGSGEPSISSATEPSSGVLGLSRLEIGVLGIAEAVPADPAVPPNIDEVAVEGHLHSGGGGNRGAGRLGHFTDPAVYGVYSDGDMHVEGSSTATGTKFVEPHRFDPSKEIRYVAVEAPSAEIYFRGTAKIAQGVTRIEVPEHFRQVARPGSYATILTAAGASATVAVLSEDENGIVVRASRDVRVNYVVYAERETFRDLDPLIENIHFRPESADGFGPGLLEEYRGILIGNGTLNSDGTVNLETARRLGWDKYWRESSKSNPSRPE